MLVSWLVGHLVSGSVWLGGQRPSFVVGQLASGKLVSWPVGWSVALVLFNFFGFDMLLILKNSLASGHVGQLASCSLSQWVSLACWSEGQSTSWPVG